MKKSISILFAMALTLAACLSPSGGSAVPPQVTVTSEVTVTSTLEPTETPQPTESPALSPEMQELKKKP